MTVNSCVFVCACMCCLLFTMIHPPLSWATSPPWKHGSVLSIPLNTRYAEHESCRIGFKWLFYNDQYSKRINLPVWHTFVARFRAGLRRLGTLSVRKAVGTGGSSSLNSVHEWSTRAGLLSQPAAVPARSSMIRTGSCSVLLAWSQLLTICFWSLHAADSFTLHMYHSLRCFGNSHVPQRSLGMANMELRLNKNQLGSTDAHP